MVFIDTNVWVYALSEQDHAKKKKATDLIVESYANDTICISSQVLKEFANFAFKKTRKTAAEINAILHKLASYALVPDTKELVMSAVEAKEKWRIGFYDALMVAAAREAGCPRLYSEDLNDGQDYGGVIAINPFK